MTAEANDSLKKGGSDPIHAVENSVKHWFENYMKDPSAFKATPPATDAPEEKKEEEKKEKKGDPAKPQPKNTSEALVKQINDTVEKMTGQEKPKEKP